MTPETFESTNVGELLITAIQRGQDRTAFICGDRHISYREFGEQLSQLTQVFTQRGLRHGDTIAALSVNRPEAFFVSAAGYLLGLRVLWMNPIASADDHLYQVNDADVKLLAVDPASFGDRAETLREKADRPLQIMGLGPEYSCGLRPELARNWSAASQRRFSSVALALSFSEGAIQCIGWSWRFGRF